MAIELIRRTRLGEIEGKEYFWAVYTDAQKNSVSQLEWRIPDIREAIQAQIGYKILSADFSQIELRIVAFLSQDRALIAAINSGKDIHSANAVTVFGKRLGFDYELMEAARRSVLHPRHNELSLLRSRIKRVSFGIVYGAGPGNIALECEMYDAEGKPDIPKALALIQDFFAAFPDLKRWLDRMASEALRWGYTASTRGRKRFYLMPPIDDPNREEILAQIRRWAGNQPIQSGCTDLLKLAMIGIYNDLRERGYGFDDARILFVVHDEIVMTCRDELVEEVREIMERNMTRAYDMLITGIQNRVHVLVGDSWEKD